ncbi:MAG: diguanylate cyclase, partial [Acidobacteria bacterium]|nr:diguanylate cyclase [Acidobacteriota bacterium]
KTGRFPPRYDKGTLVPRLYEIPVDHTRDPGRHVLAIRVHNPGPRPGGLEMAPRLEALVPALRRESSAELRTAILASVLASLGFFALLLFARNRGSDELLWFSLFAFGTALFQTIWLPSVTHSGIPLTLLFRFSIAGAFFLPGLFAIFMLRFFDRELTRFHLALFATLGLFSLVCFVWPAPDALYRLLPVAYVFVTAIVAVTFQILVGDARRGLPYARVLLPVLALLALAVFHDIGDDLGLFGAYSLDARLYGSALLVFLSVVMLLMAERFARLRLAASTDPLTSLANRGALFDRTTLEIARAKRRLHHVALAILDVDHFKRWNDRFGHVAGDRLLVAVARALRESVRDTDLAARFGGEEFVVLLPETDEAQAMVVLERIRQAVSAIRLPGIAEGVTISSGLSVLEPSVTTSVAPSSWLRRADGALYQAKAGGRNRIVVATRAPGGSSAGSGSGIRPLSGTSRGA